MNFCQPGTGEVETAHDRVADGDGGGMDFDQHFIVLGRRFFYFFAAEEHPVGRILCRQLLSFSHNSF